MIAPPRALLTGRMFIHRDQSHCGQWNTLDPNSQDEFHDQLGLLPWCRGQAELLEQT
jgi:hypothetical protein